MDLKIVNTGNTTNISTISTTVSTTTPSNITRTVSFKIIWKELDSPGETTDVLTCFSACTNENLCRYVSSSKDKTNWKFEGRSSHEMFNVPHVNIMKWEINFTP